MTRRSSREPPVLASAPHGGVLPRRSGTGRVAQATQWERLVGRTWRWLRPGMLVECPFSVTHMSHMSEDARRDQERASRPRLGTLELHGIYAGLIAGSSLLLMEMVVSALFWLGMDAPLRYAASVIMREHAFVASPLLAIVAGLAVHIAASTVFGFAYGLVASAESPITRRSWLKQLGTGGLFGAAIWAVDFHLIARVGYPWFLETGLALQLVLHVLAFGVPLAMVYVLLRRRPMAEPAIRPPRLGPRSRPSAVSR